MKSEESEAEKSVVSSIDALSGFARTMSVLVAHKIGFHSLFGLNSTVEFSNLDSKYFRQACMNQLIFLLLYHGQICTVRGWTFAGTSTSRLVIGRPTEPMLQSLTEVISWSRSPITASENWRWTGLQRIDTCNSSLERRIGQQGIPNIIMFNYDYN